ncbi:hypothetical protein A7985_10675 [Pseudoalteromonas luteoviolacea]|uniref:Uncharacterized protein n=1 Tax=Pseudoalteromonas luteoviolacea TaxID=43657 RepID=A0A1C0TSJ8_9GAMM|nr:hypothetical protein A7985_10675 [Pseudoalteromonas luteoviolacea]
MGATHASSKEIKFSLCLGERHFAKCFAICNSSLTRALFKGDKNTLDIKLYSQYIDCFEFKFLGLLFA